MDWRVYLGELLSIKNYWQKANNQRYFFVHIPKTGGTTFRYLLYQQFQQHQIFPNKEIIKNNKGEYLSFHDYKRLSEEEQQKINLIFGHFYAGFYDQLYNTQMLTFIREPVARVISNLRHMQVKTNVYEGKTVEEIYELRKGRMPNLQIRYFSPGKWIRNITQKDLDEAKKNLEKCAFVGVMERFEESLQIAEKLFDWNFTRLGKLNTIDTKPELFKPQFLDYIEETNQLDIEFYQFGVQLFEEKLRSLH